jgi:hypothetical protein
MIVYPPIEAVIWLDPSPLLFTEISEGTVGRNKLSERIT